MQSSVSSPADSLADEVSAAGQLLQLLEQEQTYLVNADVEGLSRLTGEKANIVARMTELAKRRHRALAVAGFAADESGMSVWLNSAAATASANQSWNQLLTIAQQAKEMNRTNGVMINRQIARNQNALNILHGAPQGGAIYGPDGQSASQSGSRRLVVG
jgi:flagellar biosynthesis protein FlgN